MANDEAYLDELLNSMLEGGQKPTDSSDKVLDSGEEQNINLDEMINKTDLTETYIDTLDSTNEAGVSIPEQVEGFSQSELPEATIEPEFQSMLEQLELSEPITVSELPDEVGQPQSAIEPDEGGKLEERDLIMEPEWSNEMEQQEESELIFESEAQVSPMNQEKMPDSEDMEDFFAQLEEYIESDDTGSKPPMPQDPETEQILEEWPVVEETLLSEETAPTEELPLTADVFIEEVPLNQSYVMDEEDMKSKDMESEDIEAALDTESILTAETDELQNTDSGFDMNDLDIEDLLGSMGDDEDLAEIKGLLDKAENNELIEDDEVMSLLDKAMEQGEDLIPDLPQRGAQTEAAGGKKKDKKIKLKKKKGSAHDKSADSDTDKGAKKGFFAKLFSALTDSADDESEHDTEDKEKALISGENQEILDDLEMEDKKTGKAAKSKKNAKVPKGKGDKDSKGGSKAKKAAAKPKPKKAAKPKKEKKKKEEAVDTSKKIPLINIVLAFIFALTLFAAIMVICTFLPDFVDRQNVQQALSKNDYTTVYELLYNKKISESDNEQWNKAFVVLQIERKEDSYYNYKVMNMPVEALDALLQGVEKYRYLTETGLYGADDQVHEVYQRIMHLLDVDYGITEQDADTILGYDSRNYTLKLHSVIDGTVFGEQPDGVESVGAVQESQDMLPEEEDMIN